MTDMDRTRARLDRELMRLVSEAELNVAERVDPDDTMTAAAIAGREPDLVRDEFRRLVGTDAIVLDLLTRAAFGVRDGR